MSELDDIKARAAERRNRRERYSTLGNPELATEAEADLDRAIAIADEWKVRALEAARLYGELRKARAAVLKLRDAVQRMWDIDCGYQDRTGPNVLAETESYEQYR